MTRIQRARPLTTAATVLLVIATVSQRMADAADVAETSELISIIKSVDKKAKGNPAAGRAVAELAAAEPGVLLDLLAAFDNANPLAANYLRSVAETVVDKAIADKKPLPRKRLETFIGDLKNNPQARRLAFEILERVDDTVVDLYCRPPSALRRRHSATDTDRRA